MTIDAFWRAFLTARALPPETPYYEAFYFDDTRESAAHLLSLVLSGKKRATSSALPCYAAEGSALPQVGDYSIVTDFDGQPACVIQTTSVRILPFRDMTFDLCRMEGEDDSLASWRSHHIPFFTACMAEAGLRFTEDMDVVFEEFDVVYKKENEK